MIAFSALTGTGIKIFYRLLEREIWNKRIPTGKSNRWFDEMLAQRTSPLIEGKHFFMKNSLPY
ncbi:hypothetical protein [Entomobacter blattae]|uniref:Uncharacterized protein n=1 Tax=Entomobacter blattae TaxID=2762277 RepID=A0A7H1NU66_9PROT|nr:hypothetical protein [Entomobacter blattae]QNT79326.1 hypothetical protein JGUZn3_21230 [Entomobacter blattae]